MPRKYSITMEPTAKAVKFLFYGVEGIGKSTLASKLPNVIFIDTEGSTEHMTVARYPRPKSWAELLDMVQDARTQPKLQTLVIDTLDWADALCASSLIAEKQWDSIETPGYGKGYTMLKERFGKLLNALNELADAGINVGFTAHAQLRKIENPEDTGAYDHWEMKCSKQVAPLVREWCDLMLFLNYESVVIHGNTKMDKNKVAGNKRMMYASHQPTFDAKNRFGLPDKLPLEYDGIRAVFERKTERKSDIPEPKQQEEYPDVPFIGAETGAAIEPDADPLAKINQSLASLMRTNGVTYEELQGVVGERGYYPADMPIEFYAADFVEGCLIAAWDNVHNLILKRRK